MNTTDFTIENSILISYNGTKKDITIPANIKKIDKNAFKEKKITSVKLGYSGTVADAPTNAFDGWVNNVASTGTFYYNGDDTLINFGFPEGWVINPFANYQHK